MVVSAGTYSKKTFDNFTVTNLNCDGHEGYFSECTFDPWMSGGQCGSSSALELNCSKKIGIYELNSVNRSMLF